MQPKLRGQDKTRQDIYYHNIASTISWRAVSNKTLVEACQTVDSITKIPGSISWTYYVFMSNFWFIESILAKEYVTFLEFVSYKLMSICSHWLRLSGGELKLKLIFSPFGWTVPSWKITVISRTWTSEILNETSGVVVANICKVYATTLLVAQHFNSTGHSISDVEVRGVTQYRPIS